MLPSVLALVVWLAVGARVAAEPGSSRALLGGALVRGAGAPAAGAYPPPAFRRARRVQQAAHRLRWRWGRSAPRGAARAVRGVPAGRRRRRRFRHGGRRRDVRRRVPAARRRAAARRVRGGVHHRERFVREHRALLRDRAHAHALVVARQVLQRGTRRVERRGGRRRAEPH